MWVCHEIYICSPQDTLKHIKLFNNNRKSENTSINYSFVLKLPNTIF